MTDSNERPVDHQELLRQAMADSGPADAGRPRAPELEELAPHFPDHEILGLIGRGGMGAVYKAVQRKLDRVVALKILPRELAADAEFGERFLREARALASLNHPHVLTVHDFGEAGGFYYLATEFVDGVNLRQLMELGQLSPAEALRITPQICQALQYAHEHGVVHRDVKPENILVDAHGQVKIADFGLAKLVRPGDQVALTRSTEVFGTPHYMAPEQWRGSASVDHRADIFSLGVVLYEMLTGQLPIGHFDPPSRQPGVPRGLDQVVQRSLAQQPENRYQSARDVETDVALQARTLSKTRAPARAAGRLSAMPIFALTVLVLVLIGMAALRVGVRRGEVQATSYEQDQHRYQADFETVAAAPQSGAEWDGELPVASVPPPQTSPLPSRSIAGLLVFGGAVPVVLFVMVLGFWSVRRIRQSKGALRGMPLAVFTAWLVPLTVANIALFMPIASIQDHDGRQLATFAAVVLLGAGDIVFLAWQTRRQNALAAAYEGRPASSGLLVIGVVMAFLVVAVVGAGALFLAPSQMTVHISSTPVRPAELLGQTRETVFQRLGPPLAIQVDSDGQVWTYRSAAGDVVEQALTFSGSQVIGYDPGPVLLVPNPYAGSGPHLGQKLTALVEEIGLPVDSTAGTLTKDFMFADGLRVTVRDGVVVGITRDR